MNTNKNLSKLGTLVGGFGLSTMATNPAMAAALTFGTVEADLTGTIANVVTIVGAVGLVVVGLIAAMKGWTWVKMAIHKA